MVPAADCRLFLLPLQSHLWSAPTKMYFTGSSFYVPRCSRKLADTMATGEQFVNDFPGEWLT
jgi:hypothetical protein